MRREFKGILYNEMKSNNKIVVISCDLGYGFFDDIKKDLSNQFITCRATEQLAVGMAVGMADCGFIPIVYSITPFLLFRPAEWIRNFLHHEGSNVKLLGAGRDDDYHSDGFTHYAGDDKQIMGGFPGVVCYWPEHASELQQTTKGWLYNGKPSYLNLKR